MEFLVDFEVNGPEGTTESEVRDRAGRGVGRRRALHECMHVTVTPLEAHTNDPAAAQTSRA